MGQINIVGCGTGSEDYLLPIAKTKIENASIIVASEKTAIISDKINSNPKEKFIFDKNLNEVIDFLEEKVFNKGLEATILLTGDPGFYSLLSLLKKKFPGESFNIIPGISSIQVAFARLNEIWHDGVILSLHGRSENLSKLCQHLRNQDKTCVLLGNLDTHELKEKLLQNNIPEDQEVAICANLTLPEEEVLKTTIKNLDSYSPKKDCLLVFTNSCSTSNARNHSKVNNNDNIDGSYTNIMIKDSEFIREKVPMTKEEIRTIILAKLNLFKGATIWDIGAGTGSISIQGALNIGTSGAVYAIDHKDEAVKLIKKNIEKFNCPQVIPIRGKAPEVLKELPNPDRVVIGGSDKKIIEIINYLEEQNKFEGAVVIPTIAFETFEKAYNYLKNNKNWTIDVTSLQVNNLESLGAVSLWKSKNPVSIITATKSV
ncbi:precorrin-6y C5,15-methyltransferase (decarboxylating) subunit CbiE [Natranaerofaba carboxydovora]|uniref:precorrin-6y C5,15-methyltransferase (decarboxylating) subunit CbiE n=1 Tax=Natranaerofaba carboxydovora TaxID=2742683 RepID=UPI001F12BD6C|nr:precorrin-6y C5,15-methyltransferase (decarboxylating) subunit CbiE [Natranaerofaba carboxydovora]UMZ73139.1 Cobalamin biosynthesis bifunctional protein CbiET [Natranaerofaba carboxydovora]